MEEKEFERWREQVEIYCAALEEFLNDCVARAPEELKEIAGPPLLKLQNRMDTLRSKYEEKEKK